MVTGSWHEQGMQELDNLGRVKYILVPSPFHRLDAAVYKQRYPDAQVIWSVSFHQLTLIVYETYLGLYVGLWVGQPQEHPQASV